MEQGSERYLWGLLSKMKIFNSTLKPRYTGYKKNVEEVYPNKRSGNATDFEDLQKTDVTTYPLYNMTKRNEVYPTATDYNLNDVISTNTPAGSRYPARLQVIFDKLRWKCFEEQNNEPPLETDGPYCYRMVDAYGGCWPDTMPGKYAKISCPDIPMLFNHKGHAYRECTLNGTWFVNATSNNTWANYSECRQTEEISDDNKYIYIFIGGFSLSLVMLIISLCIFFRFRQLRCDRITIHKNLFMSYVLTGISWILYYVLAALNGDVIVSNPIWCQALHILCQYFMVCNFLWMFCEGLYLNTIMVCAFNSGKILIISCYAVGWGLPIIFTTTYAVIRSSNADYSVDCWIQESSLLWIVYGPVVVSIGVNVLFLINIVRLLITKLRQMPEADQTRKATRATLILVPLLGLQYLLFPVRPEAGSDLEDVYHVAVALLVSLQGAFVSLMYCFCNSEVIQVLRRKWNQHRLMHRSSMRASTNHGTTYTTMDPVTQANTTYCSTADHKGPSLEMTNMEDKANN